jgi:hypothetical protein
MDVDEDLMQAGAPQDSLDPQVGITTCLLDGAPQTQFLPYEHDADLRLKHKKRSKVGSTSKSTSSERNRKARLDRLFHMCILITRNFRQLKAEMVGQARELMAQNMPFPPKVKKAFESYERDKARNRVYLYVLYHSTRHEVTFTIDEKRGRQKRERSTSPCEFLESRRVAYILSKPLPLICFRHNSSIPLLLIPP